MAPGVREALGVRQLAAAMEQLSSKAWGSGSKLPHSKRWRAVRSPDICGMRAERAQLKSRRDGLFVAPGKRSAARGWGRKLIHPFFLSGLARSRRAKPERKKGFGVWGVLPRAAACAALPWAMFLPPRWGSGKANQPASGKAGSARLLTIGYHCPGLPEPGR